MTYQSAARLGARLVRAPVAALALAAVALAAPSQALAALAFGTMTIDQPTGTVGPEDTVDVFLTLTLNPMSDPIRRDPVTKAFTSGGLNPAVDFVGFDLSKGVTTNLSLTFSCALPNPLFCPSEPASPYTQSVNTAFSAGLLSFDPGQSVSFRFGTYTPKAPVAPGTYVQQGYGLSIIARGFNDINGAPLTRGFSIARTCFDCTFSRTVQTAVGGVPEPATWGLMIGGFGLTGSVLRRRRTMTAG